MHRPWLSLGVAILLVGCATQTAPPPAPADGVVVSHLQISADTPHAVRGWLEDYRTLEGHFSVDVPRAVPLKNMVERELVFPSPVQTRHPENNLVHLKVWTPSRPGKHPTLIVLHHRAGAFAHLEDTCRTFARRGIAAALLYLPYYGPRLPEGLRHAEDIVADSPDGIVAFLRQSVGDVRRARDALATLPEVDPDRIGLFGISLGALVGSLTAGVDGSFPHCTLLAGGGDPAAMIFSGSKETERIRRTFEKAGMDAEAARRFMESVDPLSYASRINPGSVHMYNMSGDEVIPRDCTEALLKAIEGPSIEWFPGKHRWVTVFTSKIVRKTVDVVNDSASASRAGASPSGK